MWSPHPDSTRPRQDAALTPSGIPGRQGPRGRCAGLWTVEEGTRLLHRRRRHVPWPLQLLQACAVAGLSLPDFSQFGRPLLHHAGSQRPATELGRMHHGCRLTDGIATPVWTWIFQLRSAGSSDGVGTFTALREAPCPGIMELVLTVVAMVLAALNRIEADAAVTRARAKELVLALGFVAEVLGSHRRLRAVLVANRFPYVLGCAPGPLKRGSTPVPPLLQHHTHARHLAPNVSKTKLSDREAWGCAIVEPLPCHPRNVWCAKDQVKPEVPRWEAATHRRHGLRTGEARGTRQQQTKTRSNAAHWISRPPFAPSGPSCRHSDRRAGSKRSNRSHRPKRTSVTCCK